MSDKVERPSGLQKNSGWPHKLMLALCLAVLATLVTVMRCQQHYQQLAKVPAISGIVLDKATRRPIGGVKVMASVLGFSRNPIVGLAGSSGPWPVLPNKAVSTDEIGRFETPGGQVPLSGPDSGGDWRRLVGPPKTVCTEVILYHPEFITVVERTRLEGLGPEYSRFGDPPQATVGDVRRIGDYSSGYHYTIYLKRAQTESDWALKCKATILLADRFAEADRDTMLFNDLTGYLERWPEGEKRDLYMELLLRTAKYFDPEDYDQARIGASVLDQYIDRDVQLLALMEKYPILHPASVRQLAKDWDLTKQGLAKSIDRMKARERELEGRSHVAK